jgi:hypothetical protein
MKEEELEVIGTYVKNHMLVATSLPGRSFHSLLGYAS